MISAPKTTRDFPIRFALETASRETGIPLESRERGLVGMKYVALSALKLAFPQFSTAEIAREMGFQDCQKIGRRLSQARRSKSWREVHVDAVLGALAAPEYGERAQ